jgi:hypothetical protein
VPLLNSLKSGMTAWSVALSSRIASWTVTFVAEPQVVPVQTKFGPRQSALPMQVVLHAPVPQTYGLHGLVAGVTQVLAVLQVAAGVSVDPVQVAPAQTVPAAYFRQAPPPLHVPSVPHVEAP